MIHLRLRTEYSFRRAFGKVEDVIRAAGGTAAAITDGGTWGHVAFQKAAKKAGVKPILGVEVYVVNDPRARGKELKGTGTRMALLARNTDGLRELYQVMTVANSDEFFYYIPRLGYDHINAVSENIFIISGANPNLMKLQNRGNVYLELNPENPPWNRKAASLKGWKRIVCCDNLYPTIEDRGAYEILAAREKRFRTTIMHVANEWELREAIPEAKQKDFDATEEIAAECNAELPKAKMVVFQNPTPLDKMCRRGAKQKGIDLKDPVYKARLKRELDMIREKDFEDYFYVIADMVQQAKRVMFVGPARGSSAGSLVCYLLDITDVDPIKHDLMFERFIDITRADLPDIDIDFPDDKRHLVITQLEEKYGKGRVGRIGTVLRYKAKSTLGDVAKELSIPPWEIKDLKDAVIDRSTGDARAQFAVADALEGLELGKALLAKYPELKIAGILEGHAKTSGTHAAGVIVIDEPVTNFCTVQRDGTAQIDKKDAEELNMLKIDALGLRTLTVLADCLEHVGKPREWLINYPLDDTEAFEIFNLERFAGIFQYEGYALQSLCRQMKIRNFDDIAVITALARPGPLHCGAATEFILRRIGQEKVVHLHDLCADLTEETYGTVIYQEQVMAIGRKMGQLSWEDVSMLRKAMSKSLGDEFFNQYWDKFKEGALAQKVPEAEARRIWDKICTFGSWAFNKSHAVSYGLLSYWCSVLKAHHPLEYAAACLRNAKDDEQAIKILRDLAKEGFAYKPVDPRHSTETWRVVDGVLVGGLTNIKGIGPATAKQIMERRAAGKGQTPSITAKLMNPVTPFDDIFEGQRRFGDIYANPAAHKVFSGKVWNIIEINDPGEYVFMGKLKEKNLRDLNEYHSLVKRKGRLVKHNNLFLNLVVEDDSGQIICKIKPDYYKTLGKPIVEAGKIGDWYMFKGRLKDDGWRVIELERVRPLETRTQREAS